MRTCQDRRDKPSGAPSDVVKHFFREVMGRVWSVLSLAKEVMPPLIVGVTVSDADVMDGVMSMSMLMWLPRHDMLQCHCVHVPCSWCHPSLSG